MKKKITVLALVSALIVSAAACSGNNPAAATTTAAAATTTTAADTTTTTEAAATTETNETAGTEAGGNETATGVMSYAEYAAAPIDSPVTVETYVQAKQSWWEDKATVYTQDEDGAYFLYNMACSEADYEKLTPGTKIRVSGFKSEWSGEIEITDATFEIIDGSFIAEPLDVTDILSQEDALLKHQNEYVSFKNMKVKPITDADGVEHAFLYNWDGSGDVGSDLYFKVVNNSYTLTFTVESYLCGPDTDVYKAVQNLKVDDMIDMEGFPYWYNGVNPHITSVTPAGTSADAAGVMSFDEFKAADLDTQVTVETFVQAKQGWWEENGVGKASFYTQNEDHSAYFLYNMPCTIDEYNALTPGTKIRVTGYKAEWSGEVEITDAAFEVIDGTFIAPAEDVTELLGDEAKLAEHMNEFVTFKNIKILPILDADGVEHPFLYNWDGSGEEGSDLYFNGVNNSYTYTFTVESYLCGPGTEVYEAVKNLQVNGMYDLEGFLYWYNGANPHITSVKQVTAE